MKFPNFPKKGVRNIFCGRNFVEADKVGHLCEPVYDHHYLRLTLRFW